ncbi:MAG: peptidase A24, partial [Bacillota bacterium]
FLFALQGLGLGLALLLLPFVLGGVGGGDVKFLAAVGALGGPAFVWRAFLYGALTGGVLALGLLLRRRELWRVLRKIGGLLYARLRHLPPAEPLGTLEAGAADRLPYGLALGLGVVAALYLPF